MPLHQNSAGSLLYVWSERQGERSKTKAVISAHGGEAKINGMADVPQCNLVFYCPHGDTLKDPKIEGIITRQVLSCEVLPSREAQDYQLFKYTNTGAAKKHNRAGETYATVRAMKDHIAARHTEYVNNVTALNGMNNLTANDQKTKRLQQALAQLYGECPMDIITIRSRFWQKAVLLSQVLKELHAAGYDYEEIHCSFCRGSGPGYVPMSLDLTA